MVEMDGTDTGFPIVFDQGNDNEQCNGDEIEFKDCPN
jgi:hypothetical protein